MERLLGPAQIPDRSAILAAAARLQARHEEHELAESEKRHRHGGQ